MKCRRGLFVSFFVQNHSVKHTTDWPLFTHWEGETDKTVRERVDDRGCSCLQLACQTKCTGSLFQNYPLTAGKVICLSLVPSLCLHCSELWNASFPLHLGYCIYRWKKVERLCLKFIERCDSQNGKWSFSRFTWVVAVQWVRVNGLLSFNICAIDASFLIHAQCHWILKCFAQWTLVLFGVLMIRENVTFYTFLSANIDLFVLTFESL